MAFIKVLVVDDSAFMRRQLTAILEADPKITVVGTARNGEEALAKLKELEPDVITLDINMPVMDGLTALTYLMLERPTPTVVISSLTHEGALATFEALELGAVDFVAKSSGTVSLDIRSVADEIVAKVRSAARARLRRKPARALASQPRPAAARSERPKAPKAGRPASADGLDPIVAIGVSTGGPRTLLDILPSLPDDLPAPVVIVQHMPPAFTKSFAEHLDAACQIPVKEAEQGEKLLPGRGYVAPGGLHLTTVRSAFGAGAAARLQNRTDNAMFCPSVGVLFDSVAKLYGPRAVGVLLTGMGDDGADGLVAIRRAGGITIAESEATAVIFGMPREAIERGGAEIVAPSTDIASQIQAALRRIAPGE